MNYNPARICTIEAPCKINLHLKIGEKRPDGFHNLESLMVNLAFGDTIRFEETGEKGDSRLIINWETPEEALLLKENLIFHAISLFRKETGYENGLKINLSKRIPSGAGLGGGSSDAASTLLALNSLCKTAFSMEKLSEMASMLGSDVPFFLFKGAAFVSGRGELVEPVKLSNGFYRDKLQVVLVKPPFSSSTAIAYGLLDKARENNSWALNHGKNVSREAAIQALGKDPKSWPYYNDFLPVLTAAESGENQKNALCLKAILKDLSASGAVFTGLSGSGSCCFGVFCSMDMAKRAEKLLSGNGNFTKLTFFLAQNAYPVLE